MKSVWLRKEKELGVRVPSELRSLVEQHYSEQVHNLVVELRDFEDAVGDFIRRDLPTIVAFAQGQAATPRAEALPQHTRLRGRARMYRKPFERRLRIVDFVAQRAVPFAHLVRRELDTAGRQVDWKHVSDEWNKAYPDDTMSPERLRVMWERARREEYLRETYFDGKFRDWAKLAESLRPTLSWLAAAGLRPEDIYVHTETVVRPSTQLVEDARRMLAEAQALRRANEVENIDPETRRRNEIRADTFEASAKTLMQVSQVKAWSVVSPKVPPAAGRALARAIKRNCGLTEGFVAYPRGTAFCERPHCHKCKFGADLLEEGVIHAPGGLRPHSAKGAAERHKQRLDESARVIQRLANPSSDSRHPGEPPSSG
jgi:hypothetical protein